MRTTISSNCIRPKWPFLVRPAPLRTNFTAAEVSGEGDMAVGMSTLTQIIVSRFPRTIFTLGNHDTVPVLGLFIRVSVKLM